MCSGPSSKPAGDKHSEFLATCICGGQGDCPRCHGNTLVDAGEDFIAYATKIGQERARKEQATKCICGGQGDCPGCQQWAIEDPDV